MQESGYLWYGYIRWHGVFLFSNLERKFNVHKVGPKTFQCGWKRKSCIFMKMRASSNKEKVCEKAWILQWDKCMWGEAKNAESDHGSLGFEYSTRLPEGSLVDKKCLASFVPTISSYPASRERIHNPHLNWRHAKLKLWSNTAKKIHCGGQVFTQFTRGWF